MHETVKQIILKRSSTQYLLALKVRANRNGGEAVECGGIVISVEELKKELALRPHIPNKAESPSGRRLPLGDQRKERSVDEHY